MLHNKYACDNPVQVTNDGDLYTFTYLDCRQTSRQAIRSILNEYAYSYFCNEGLLSRVPGIYCGQIPFIFYGNSANILLISGVGEISNVLTLGGEPLTLDLEELTLG